jgi:hypothetical protein
MARFTREIYRFQSIKGRSSEFRSVGHETPKSAEPGIYLSITRSTLRLRASEKLQISVVRNFTVSYRVVRAIHG